MVWFRGAAISRPLKIEHLYRNLGFVFNMFPDYRLHLLFIQTDPALKFLIFQPINNLKIGLYLRTHGLVLF
jgi:hypothetical protein